MKTLHWLLLAGFLLRLVLSVQIYSGDVNNHISWGRDILRLGPAGVYQRDFTSRYGTMTPTYPPLPLAVFTISQWLYDSTYTISNWANSHFQVFPSRFIWLLEDQDVLPAFHKIWAILADIGIAYLVYKFTQKTWLTTLVLFNPAFFYNSAYWGQIEAIPIFFLLASFYFLTRTRRSYLSALCFVLALLSKQSSIIFIPIFALAFWQKFGLRISVTSALIGLVFFSVSFLPFLANPFVTYWQKIQTGSGSDFITDHAFNLWALLTGLGKVSDSAPYWLGISYNHWGFILFGLALVFILIKFRPSRLFAASALINLASFLLLTRMHERYLQPSLAFLLLWAGTKRSLLAVFIFLSGFYWLNLYHNWWAPRIPSLVTWLSSPDTINLLIVLAFASFTWLILRYDQA